MKFLLFILVVLALYLVGWIAIKPHLTSTQNNFTEFSKSLDSLGK